MSLDTGQVKVQKWSALDAIQATWDAVFLDNPYKVNASDAVCRVLGQYISEWRAGFGSAAVMTMEIFFESKEDFNDYEMQQEFAKSMLKDLAFLFLEVGKKTLVDGTYSDFSNMEKFPPRGALAMSAAAVECVFTLWANREILWEPKDQITETWMDEAVNLKLYAKPLPKLNKSTGKETATHNKFLDMNWGSTTRKYYNSTKSLKVSSLEEITHKALVFT
ncbi:hypothetical protein SERLA73DRAFT_156363 [Serpula lacrymans var. lacrymans S7.3]|uniref:Uncharacterized protein n=1 Tax=Serpula lacrymans var. lacrymans (strain S7.3) TaxID=936435 RepID=F8QE58_SERL3|nr:hypothetical protein SERLA73DRAFT_156363 [Serpula lacrymans var. lacrymans S7.3]